MFLPALLALPLLPPTAPSSTDAYVQAQWRAINEPGEPSWRSTDTGWRDGKLHLAHFASTKKVTVVRLLATAEISETELRLAASNEAALGFTVTFAGEHSKDDALGLARDEVLMCLQAAVTDTSASSRFLPKGAAEVSALIDLAGDEVSPAAAAAFASTFESKTGFAEARKPYIQAEYTYDLKGYVNKKGEVRGEGLACSSFACPVLQRMKHGAKDWLKSYQSTLHQLYGHLPPQYLELTPSAAVPASVIQSESDWKELLDQGVLAAGLYYFNVRKGPAGHVGFVTVGADGGIDQSQFSGIEDPGGHIEGDFRTWLQRSQYRKQVVELYLVPTDD